MLLRKAIFGLSRVFKFSKHFKWSIFCGIEGTPTNICVWKLGYERTASLPITFQSSRLAALLRLISILGMSRRKWSYVVTIRLLSMVGKRIISLILFISMSLQAEPWIGTENLSLRADVQLLADYRLISTPTTTFPLMWGSIVSELNQIELEKLPENVVVAYLNVKRHARLVLRPQSRLKLSAGNEVNRFASFGDTFRDKNSINITSSVVGKKWAGKISYSYLDEPIDGDEYRLDDSYLAFNWGNWVISAGLQNRWWGPGWDTSMALTNNARPIPSISLSRNSSEGFNVPFFENTNIPWTMTTYMGRMEKERTIPHTLLWGFRITARPLPQLEVGVTRLAQWAGDGRPNDASTFWDLFIGKDNCGVQGLNCDDNQEPGNQLAGYDARWSSLIGQNPYSIYMQAMAEDGSASSGKFLTEIRYQVGIDTQLNILEQNIRVFLEASDTFADCSGVNDDGTGNCFYEHHIYRTGLRFNQRVIANIYDNDARTYVFGVISQINKSSNWQAKLRILKLNQDNRDVEPGNPLVGNTLTEIAEKMTMLSGKYQWQSEEWSYSVGSRLSRSTFDSAEKSTDFSLFASVTFTF